ncbi:hypothetical protein APHAL10511_006731 [Amanita phalloides]|nr:hypothetical protein APHAL10511_006731 [Amanita phalloides]
MPEIVPMFQPPSIVQDKRRYAAQANLDRSYCHPTSRHQAVATPAGPYWQQLPIRMPYTLPDHLAQPAQFSPLFSSFPTQETEWTMDPVVSTTYIPTLQTHTTQTLAYATEMDYPESSQRTDLSSSPVNSTDYGFQSDVPKSPSKSPDFSDDGHRLYTMDDLDTSASCRSSPVPPIKMEQPDVDGCFVMELSPAQVKAISLSQSMAPPTEITPRAIHATEEMRKMMGRFRIDPFAIHNGENRSVVASWCGEACPLEEEPLIFEFQLDLNSSASRESSKDIHLEVQTGDSDVTTSHCDEYCHNDSILPSNCTSEWNEEQPPPELVTGYYHQLRELHESYLRKCAENTTQNGPIYVAATNSTQFAHHSGQRAEFWSRNGPFNSSARRTYSADSPRCDNAVLPSISATVSRRWGQANEQLVSIGLVTLFPDNNFLIEVQIHEMLCMIVVKF